MFERIAFLKLAPHAATAENRAAIARRAFDVLRPLPTVQALTVGIAADDDSAAAWDLCITAQFATPEDAAAYRVHPDHRRFADEYVAPQCEARKAWSFVTERR
jgi:Stress responsive A/B Barrel Domain